MKLKWILKIHHLQDQWWESLLDQFDFNVYLIYVIYICLGEFKDILLTSGKDK